MSVLIALLADCPEVIPELASAIQREWPDWYSGDGALNDLRSRCRRSDLPVGLVALEHGRAIATIAIERQSTATHAHLSPWIVGLWVDPSRRNAGIGRNLFVSACKYARCMGFEAIYAASLRRRAGGPWQHIGAGLTAGGDRVDIFEFPLRALVRLIVGSDATRSGSL